MSPDLFSEEAPRGSILVNDHSWPPSLCILGGRLQEVRLYLIWFSLCSNLLWELRDNGVVKNTQFSP